MSTPLPWSRRRPHIPAPGTTPPRRPMDWAKVGRTAVRRRATGMTAAEAAAALENAELEQHLNRDREDLADDERGPAEVAEWRRIAQLLGSADGIYDPAADAVVQDELAADRRTEAAEQQQLQEQRQAAARADKLEQLAAAGRLDRTVQSRPGDEAARDVLVQRGDYHATAVDGWLAQALADRSGHYADPTAREAAGTRLPETVTARAELLAALAATGAVGRDSKLPFVGRIASADPDAAAGLARWLTQTHAPGPADVDGGPA
ncbi:hypothetical protein [Streptomyces jumonjinensis]|uniref:hypothetical protein n=1 Tax=Streptomyces jumonjinensis TaxID=1945 RepID=UPI002B20AE10|nr:hypothetical protein [Streptomyces jumonjinensis]